MSRSPIWGFAGSGAGGSSLVLALCPRRALTAGGCTRLRAAPVPACTIHSATEKRKGPLAPFTADRSAPRGSLGSVAGDLQLLGGTRLTLARRPPGLPPRPARPTRGALPVAQLQAARCAPRASAGAASRSSSGPFEVEARTQGIPRGVLPRAALTERSARCRAPRHGRTGCISHRFDELGDPLGPRVGAVRLDQRPRACPRFADVARTYVPRFRRMPHRAASVASTKPRSTNFLTGCSSSARQTAAGARSGDPSVDALGIHRAQAASLERASGADHAAIVDHRPAHRMGIGRSAPAPDGS